MCGSLVRLTLLPFICRGLISKAGCHWRWNLFVGYSGHSGTRGIQVCVLVVLMTFICFIFWVACKSTINREWLTLVRKCSNLIPVLLQPSFDFELFTVWREGEVRQVVQILIHIYSSCPQWILTWSLLIDYSWLNCNGCEFNQIFRLKETKWRLNMVVFQSVK